MTHLFLQRMKKEKRGRIMNIASTAAFQPGPLMAVYFATKSYVLNFSEALHEELKEYNISVTTYCPGELLLIFRMRPIQITVNYLKIESCLQLQM